MSIVRHLDSSYTICFHHSTDNSPNKALRIVDFAEGRLGENLGIFNNLLKCGYTVVSGIMGLAKSCGMQNAMCPDELFACLAKGLGTFHFLESGQNTLLVEELPYETAPCVPRR